MDGDAGTTAAQAFARESAPRKAWDVARVASGNFLEMYDFMVFGYFAGPIGDAFFPHGDAFARLLAALATFGVGFLMRPIGAVVLGAFTDRRGRRAGLLLTLLLMGVGILTLTLTPSVAWFATHAPALAWLAPVLVLAGRLVQGFSAGAELGNVSVYLSEIAPQERRGFYVSWQSASQQVAVVTAAALGFAIAAVLPPDAVHAWGWRVPLGVGCLIVPLLLVMRRTLRETETFAARTHTPPVGELLAGLARAWRPVLAGVALTAMTTVSFYTITAYTPSFGKILGLSAGTTLAVTAAVGLSNLVWLPVMGALSDRIGRKPLLIGCTVLAILTAYPAMRWLALAPSFAKLLTVELWLSALYASYNSAMVVFLTEIVPAKVRASGFSLAYSLATALGGFTPYIATWLIKATGDRAIPGAWLTAAAVAGLSAALFTSEPARPSGDRGRRRRARPPRR